MSTSCSEVRRAVRPGDSPGRGHGPVRFSVTDLWVEAIRFDKELRGKMPPLMAQFARRLDDGKTFRARGDLQIGWSGVPKDPAWCKWENGLAVFDDNTVMTEIKLEHIHGQIDHVSVWSTVSR